MFLIYGFDADIELSVICNDRIRPAAVKQDEANSAPMTVEQLEKVRVQYNKLAAHMSHSLNSWPQIMRLNSLVFAAMLLVFIGIEAVLFRSIQKKSMGRSPI
jgi:hypothetical protein